MSSPLVSAGILPLADHPYAEQLAIRSARVAQALGRLEVGPIAPIVPSPRETGSRARVTVRIERGRMGFHGTGTHTFVEADLSALARPEVVVEAARVAARANGKVEIRTDGTRTVTVLEQPAELDGNVAVGGKTRSGATTLTVDGLRVSPLSFFQVNLEVNTRIVADVDAWLTELAPTHLLDLYAGIGNLSALAHRRGTPVTLFESDRSSAGDARHNLPGAVVRVQDVGRFQAGAVFFDIAVLDPPRAGALGLLARLAVTRPRAVLYLSCEPTTLARDLATLLPHGYRVALVQPYDMFPGTEHVETLVVATRK